MSKQHFKWKPLFPVILLATFCVIHVTTRNQLVLDQLPREALENILLSESEWTPPNVTAKKRQEIEVEIEESLNYIRTQYHLPEKTMKKKNIALVAGWRTGSSFTQDVIASHPDVLKIYEPLILYRRLFLTKLRNWDTMVGPFPYTNDMLRCKFTSSTMKFLDKQPYVFEIFSKTMDKCLASKHEREVCYDPSHLTQLCEMHPVSLLKYVRIPVELMGPIITMPDMDNLYIILLLRDPRAVMNSRRRTNWCKPQDCASPTILCNDMVEDLNFARNLKEMYPDRVHIVRYEEVALDPIGMAHVIYKAVGMEVVDEVVQFLEEHTNKAGQEDSKNVRDSQARVMGWADEISWGEIVEIQNQCAESMIQAGYVPAKRPKFTLDDVLAPLEDALRVET